METIKQYKNKRALNGIHNAHFGILGGRPTTTVFQYTKYGDFVNQFKSITDASKHTGVLASGISRVMKGKAKTAGGFIWRTDFVQHDEDF